MKITLLDSILFKLSKYKIKTEKIIRQIHGENYMILVKLNTRLSRLKKVQNAIKEVKLKYKAELSRKNRFLEIIEVCQKNQNLNGFFVQVSSELIIEIDRVQHQIRVGIDLLKKGKCSVK
jgi:hypothetical protein